MGLLGFLVVHSGLGKTEPEFVQSALLSVIMWWSDLKVTRTGLMAVIATRRETCIDPPVREGPGSRRLDRVVPLMTSAPSGMRTNHHLGRAMNCPAGCRRARYGRSLIPGRRH